MPKKIRDLKALLRSAGWIEVAGGGKGSHSKWAHPRMARRIILSGKDGNDALRYQEKDVSRAVAEASNS
jgi:predicted RNA binding protein YcfA (HicA-like mRNA interferase family)